VANCFAIFLYFILFYFGFLFIACDAAVSARDHLKRPPLEGLKLQCMCFFFGNLRACRHEWGELKYWLWYLKCNMGLISGTELLELFTILGSILCQMKMMLQIISPLPELESFMDAKIVVLLSSFSTKLIA